MPSKYMFNSTLVFLVYGQLSYKLDIFNNDNHSKYQITS